MNKLFVVLPCYNEGENIGELVERWKFQEGRLKENGIPYLEIVVVDDGSIDSTGTVLKSKIEDSGNIKILRHPQNKGLGEAIKTGIKYAIENSDKDDFLCIMDSDNTHHPVYVHSMFEKLSTSKCDCVIASRYQPKSRTIGVSSLRMGMSYGARLFYSIFMGIPNVKDYTCGYRLYKVSILKDIYEAYSDKFIAEKGFTCMVELLYKLYRQGAKFEEVSFELRYDLKKGASKMKVFKNALKSLYIMFKLNKLRTSRLYTN